MLNTPDSSPIPFTYEEQTYEANIQALIEFLSTKSTYKSPTEFTILEYFPPDSDVPYTPKVYNLINLKMEQEDGIVFCTDLTHKLQRETPTLFGFLASSVVYIGIKEDAVTISFDDGYIRIGY